MSFIKRAYLHTIRKREKSLIMFFVLLVIATLILTCFSIQSATDTAALNIRQSLKGGFSIESSKTESRLTDAIINKTLDISGVKSNYNARSSSYAEYRTSDGIRMEIRTEGAVEVVKGFEHAGKLISDIFSDKDNAFALDGFELIEGRHITKGDEHMALVHEDFARRNGLELGDKFILGLDAAMFENGGASDNDMLADNQIEVELVGIFHDTIPQEGGLIPSHLFYENMVFTDPTSYTELFYTGEAVSYRTIDFNVDDPAELDRIISEMKTIPGVEWDTVSVFKRDAPYQNAKKPLESLNNLVVASVFIIIVTSVALLSLILALWVRGRIHETGVLLSMGFGKVNIIMQHITEIMVVALVAFALSFAVSSAISQTVGDMMLEQSAPARIEVVNLTGDDTAIIENATTDDNVKLTKIEVTVSALNLLMVYAVGTLIIIISVMVAAYPIMRMKPKEILSTMS